MEGYREHEKSMRKVTKFEMMSFLVSENQQIDWGPSMTGSQIKTGKELVWELNQN